MARPGALTGGSMRNKMTGAMRIAQSVNSAVHPMRQFAARFLELMAFALLMTGVPGFARPQEDSPAQKHALPREEARRVAELQKQVGELRRAGKVVEAQAALREVVALRQRLQPADHWELIDDECRLKSLERTAALSAEAQAELAEVKRRDARIVSLYQKDS